MTEPLTRGEMIELLESLGSDQDDEVLRAARELHARTRAAGQSWQDLVRPDDSGDASEIHDADDGDGGSEPPADSGPANEESLALITALLAMPDCSDDLRGELEAYKADIGRGELDEADRQYIGALHKRLSRSR